MPEATLDDLQWADGFAFGTPTRFGVPAAQLKQFIDQTGPLWVQGQLSNKAATSFVPPGYTHPVLNTAGGNPYGTSYASGSDDGSVSRETLTAAHYQGHRLTQYASRLVPRATGPDQTAGSSLAVAPYDPPSRYAEVSS